MREKLRDCRGAIIVEATISLTAFMFVIVTVLSIINIATAQAKIGVAVNETAKDISQYTYLYGLTGLNSKQASLSQQGQAARTTIDTAINQSDNALDAISTLSDFVTDPELQSSLWALVKNGAAEGLKSFAADKIVRALVEDRLKSTSEGSAEAYLKHLGVVPKNGSYLKGISFYKTVICANGTNEIKVVADYEVRVLRLLGIDIKFHFTQCASTKAWMPAERAPGKGTSEEKEQDGTENDDGQEQKTAVHNADAPQVMLGQADSDPDYDYFTLAEFYNMTYLDVSALPEAADSSWEAVAFIEGQASKGKSIYLCSDPYNASGEYYMQVEWLNSNGYTIERDAATGLWKAKKE